MSQYDNGFDRAQRQYDAQMPPEDKMLTCSACKGKGEVKNRFTGGVSECPFCEGEGERPETEDDVQDRRDYLADKMHDEDVDRKMGL